MSSASSTDIGKQIRERRESLGLSREGLAFKADIAHKTVERIEAGGVMPRRGTLRLIEMAFEQTERELEAAA